jgi:hypothetical protein
MKGGCLQDETRWHCPRHVGQRSAPSTLVTAIVSQWNAQRALAAIRSSIRSRSTSQYLSAESRSLSIPSASADPLSSGISRHCVEGLLDLCRLRFDFDIRQCLRRRAASINDLPYEFLSLVTSPRHVKAVVLTVRQPSLACFYTS